jgi:hypothetical protein
VAPVRLVIPKLVAILTCYQFDAASHITSDMKHETTKLGPSPLLRLLSSLLSLDIAAQKSSHTGHRHIYGHRHNLAVAVAMSDVPKDNIKI